MILPIRYKNIDEYYVKYISLFQGELKLTERELQVLKELLKEYYELLDSGDTHPEIKLFDSRNIILFSKKNNLSINQYHNIKNSLIEKQALGKDKDGYIKINLLLLPKDNITFKFIKI